MSDDDTPEAAGGFASPPCFLHELDPAYAGLEQSVDPQQRRDVARWRKAVRERLIAERLAIERGERRRRGDAIFRHLQAAIGPLDGRLVSAYWPFRGEPDPRAFLRAVVARGGRCALPVVVARRQPLQFRSWAPGEPLEPGVWNIPVPARGAAVVPDVVIAPLVGFDPAGYRLGYGGGFYDRTLAALAQRPQVFGVGFAQAALPTIYPQPHDIPMDRVVTEAGVQAA